MDGVQLKWLELMGPSTFLYAAMKANEPYLSEAGRETLREFEEYMGPTWVAGAQSAMKEKL